MACICVRAGVAASDTTVHHLIKASLTLWMSFITKLSDRLCVNGLWNSDLCDSIGAYPGLVAGEVFCTPFEGIPTALMTKTPSWVLSDPFYPYGLHFRSCVPAVLNRLTVQLYKPHFRQQFVPDLFWCYTVLFVCALYARCNTFFSSRKTALKHSLTLTVLQDCSRFGSAQSFALGLFLHSNRHYSPKG